MKRRKTAHGNSCLAGCLDPICASAACAPSSRSENPLSTQVPSDFMGEEANGTTEGEACAPSKSSFSFRNPADVGAQPDGAVRSHPHRCSSGDECPFPLSFNLNTDFRSQQLDGSWLQVPWLPWLSCLHPQVHTFLCPKLLPDLRRLPDIAAGAFLTEPIL
ncbi:hypothetical protein B0J12DRAFT_229355 [Macrophomina phaseolina]|uniref:Uncharacterized protein n=1 Tax=Macrophomina phaseolina TaxID=35725 RepID=A0ABQ8GPT6_9PEZI|nr:hypothetical protein B0J12DRAFT_229355 [Macrophomina phaseolina]